MDRVYLHSKLNMARSAHLAYLNGFVTEEISTINSTAIYDYPGKREIVDQRLRYRKLVEEENSHIMDPEMLNLPGSFTEYLKAYIDVNTQNSCPYYSQVISDQLSCEQFSNGLMKTGLRMVIVSTLNTGDSLVKTFQEKLHQIDTTNSTQVNSTILSTMRSPEYAQFSKVSTYIASILASTRKLYIEGRHDFFSRCKAIGTSQFVGYLVVCVTMYALVWYQSSKGLGSRIIKAKRMLNMMPMELVLSNDSLKERVLSNDINRILL